jgi:hypothetical protein
MSGAMFAAGLISRSFLHGTGESLRAVGDVMRCLQVI